MVKHGTRTHYMRGCRCPRCTKAQRDYMAEYNAQKRGYRVIRVPLDVMGHR